MQVNLRADGEAAGKLAPFGLPLGGNRYLRPEAQPLEAFRVKLQQRMEAQAAEAPAMHTVRKGDTLSHIVREELKANGEAVSGGAIHRGVLAVARANALRDPNKIMPGETLDLGVLRGEAPKVAPGELANLPGQEKSAPALPEIVPDATKLAALERVPDPDLDALSRQPAEGGPVLRMPEMGAGRELLARIARETMEKTEDLGELIHKILHPGQREAQGELLSKRVNPWKSTLDGPARLTSEFGKRNDPFTGEDAFHSGIDLATKSGTKVYPFKPGTVTYSGWQSGYGNVVIVQHEDGLESVYGHNASNSVKAGDVVNGQTVLAEVGSSGRSTGPHLHFEIRHKGKAVNPVPYLVKRAEG